MAPRVPGSGKSGRCSAWMLWDDSWDEPGLSCSWPPRLDIRVGVAAQPKPDTPTRQGGRLREGWTGRGFRLCPGRSRSTGCRYALVIGVCLRLTC